ncbi:MAG: hypothetical protein R6X25_01075 [Candidatus Krumholzibacteriia bacterium]
MLFHGNCFRLLAVISICPFALRLPRACSIAALFSFCRGVMLPERLSSLAINGRGEDVQVDRDLASQSVMAKVCELKVTPQRRPRNLRIRVACGESETRVHALEPPAWLQGIVVLAGRRRTVGRRPAGPVEFVVVHAGWIAEPGPETFFVE